MMTTGAKTTIAATFTLLTLGCGGDEKKEPQTPPAPSATVTASSSATPASSAPPAVSATPSASASAAPPAPTPKGKLTSFAISANSGKVDKIGNKDGAFKADGVKDLVFDAELEGPAVAILIMSTDASGAPNGEFSADTFVGDQALPAELAANLNQGKFTGGVGVYEGDKLLNAKDGSLPPLSDGKHKLTLHISAKDAPTKGAYKAFAVFDNKSMVSSPHATIK